MLPNRDHLTYLPLLQQANAELTVVHAHAHQRYFYFAEGCTQRLDEPGAQVFVGDGERRCCGR